MQLGIDVIALVEGLPRTVSARTIASQLVRCATSVGANYRAACRSRSTAEMIAKLGVVEEEADEPQYWLELLVQAGITELHKVSPLINEAGQIAAMVVASKKTLKASLQRTSR